MKQVNLFLLLMVCLVGRVSELQAQLIKIPLENSWRFSFNPPQESLVCGIPDFNIVSTSAVTIPHTWGITRAYANMKGVGWYNRTIEIPQSWQDGRVRLCFEAVNRDARIYINKQKVYEHLGCGYTRFYVDITDHVYWGRENELVVCVSNEESETALPRTFDWNNDGGIIRPVYLEMNKRASIERLKITPRLHLRDSAGTISAEVSVYEKMKGVLMEIEIEEYATKKSIYKEKSWCKIQQSKIQRTIHLSKVQPWHFDSPHLYKVYVRTFNKAGIADERVTRIGFRQIQINGSRFYLNGEPMRLPGIEYMAGSMPLYGMAEPIDVIAKAVDLMKESNSIITRFHWQQDERLLDLLDEKGMLVQEEIPWWQSPGNLSTALYANAQQHIDEMVERDYHHPCIFSWGVSNEVYGNTDRTVFTKLIDHTRSLDSTRMVAVVSNEIFQRLDKDESLLADIPTWNEYTGTWHGKSRYELPGRFDTIYHKALNRGERPLLITEHGLCEPSFTGGDQRRIEEMVYHYDQWAQRDYVFGAIYFSLNDYRTHIGESGSGVYKTRIHGITDMNLRKKTSFGVYALLASPVTIMGVEPVESGIEADVWITVKKSLPSYTLSGYYIRWKDRNENEHTHPLPNLKPGEDYKVRLTHFHPSSTRIEVVRPNGYVVASN